MSPAFNSSSSLTAPAAGRPAGRGLASPWSHVVRGEADAATTVPSLHSRPELVDRSLPSGLAPESLSSSSIVSLRPPEVATEEQGSGGNAAGKKVWNILNDGDSEGGAVMGATWPELSESAKSFAKPTFSESLVVPDGSEIPHEVMPFNCFRISVLFCRKIFYLYSLVFVWDILGASDGSSEDNF